MDVVDRVLGGLVGMATAFGLAWLTETSWPIDVGGLPIFAWWPNLIIMFELTMLGAILATVATLVVTAGLGRGGGKLYDPAVSRRRRSWSASRTRPTPRSRICSWRSKRRPAAASG